MKQKEKITEAYTIAKEQYAEYGIDINEVLKKLDQIPISLHCWQTDDVTGFEISEDTLESGGIKVTGNYPGIARNIDEVQEDLDKILSLLPGKHRINLHAIYGDFQSGFADRNQIDIQHFQNWIDWAKVRGIGLDFNATCFAHKKANDGYTLSSKNQDIRNFWIDHVKQCRKIAAKFGKELGTPSVHNLWIPDGAKDTPVDRWTHRVILKNSLDEIFQPSYPKTQLKDSLESKLFGIGSESMVVGTHDFYLCYAAQNDKLICLDNGHFHPTEQVGDKIASCMQFIDEIMLHLTRGVRWDSDHIITLNDEIVLIAQEIIRAGVLNKVNIGLDFFDATLNRIGAYIIGARAARKAFLYALLEPVQMLKEYEENSQFFERLATLEQFKSMPFGAVWDYYCYSNGIPMDKQCITEVNTYQDKILRNRS